MPSRVITDIAHTSQTDHRILKDPAFAARTNEEPPKDTEPIDANYGATAELRFFWQSSERLPAWEQQRTRGMGQWLLGPDRSGRPRMSILEQLLPIAEQRPGDGPVQTVLGAFWMQYQRLDRAVGHFEYALEDRDVQANARSNLLTIYYLTSQWQRALELSDQLLQHDPQSVRLHALRADIYDQLGETTSALQSAEAALEMNPKLTPVRQWLIGKYELLGNQEKVSEHQTVLGAIEQIRGDRGPS
jgi:tetratricopeptide (TPR) repeat protein